MEAALVTISHKSPRAVGNNPIQMYETNTSPIIMSRFRAQGGGGVTITGFHSGSLTVVFAADEGLSIARRVVRSYKHCDAAVR